jgi:acetyl esterase/lipase
MTSRRAHRALRVPPGVMRAGVRRLGRHCLNPALPWTVQRSRLDRLAGAALLPRHTVITKETFGGVSAEVVSAGLVGSQRTVVHFHGGGYCVGSARIIRSWAAQLSAQSGCQVVLPEYRLAPENPYPAGLEDARAVLAALLGRTKPDSIVVSGDSAGGGLALAMLLARREDGDEQPAGVILLSPWLDLRRDRRAVPGLVRRDLLLTPDWLDACARAYADPEAWGEPLVSPANASHSGLPPLLIQSGADDLLAPDAEFLAGSAGAAGVDATYTRWPGLWHDFPLQAGMLAAADSAVAQAAWFIRRVTAGS